MHMQHQRWTRRGARLSVIVALIAAFLIVGIFTFAPHAQARGNASLHPQFTPPTIQTATPITLFPPTATPTPPCHTAGTTAARVYGQPNFTTATANNGGISSTSLNQPTGVTLDYSTFYLPANPRSYGSLPSLYIADEGNNRVLHYPGINKTADRVYGQPNFTSGTDNNGGLSASSLSAPMSITATGISVSDPNYNSSRTLYIADFYNSRVLGYLGNSTTADWIFGQGGIFTTNTANPGSVTDHTLYTPWATALGSAGDLYISDHNNNRALHVPVDSMSHVPANNSSADRVYGQPNFTSNADDYNAITASTLEGPAGIAVGPSDELYVADWYNSRVLKYDSGHTTATRVYGQSDFTANTYNPFGIDANHLNLPMAVAVDYCGGIYVADTFNNRVLHYPACCSSPDQVYGQPDFTSGTANNGGISATSLNHPIGLAVDTRFGQGLYVVDAGNNRVLYFP
jgi:hypothetical protein